MSEDVIQKVITDADADARLYRIRATLLHLDGPVYDFSLVSNEISKNPVPVYGLTGKQIGFASVNRGDKAVTADLSIEYASEERLLIETGQQLWACGLGVAPIGEYTHNPMFLDFSQKIVVDAVTIHKIYLRQRGPGDTRIGCIRPWHRLP